MRTFTTRHDLENWIDSQTSGWHNRRESDIREITAKIQAMSHPAWGGDWTEFLESLPELSEMVA